MSAWRRTKAKALARTVGSRRAGAAIELKSRRGIVIQMGTKIAEIPRYTWFGS